MKTKLSIILASVSATSALVFSGCEVQSDKENCNLTIAVSYGGCGIGGQPLGSGSFTDTLTVCEGDVLYEKYGGHWSKTSDDHTTPILAITSIDENGVTIRNDGSEYPVCYNNPQSIPSEFVVYDGINYEYKISFSNINE